jgi:hypothetical protein
MDKSILVRTRPLIPPSVDVTKIIVIDYRKYSKNSVQTLKLNAREKIFGAGEKLEDF